MTKSASGIHDMIRKLLAVAENTSNFDEAPAFFAKAGEFMSRYGIERADLLAQDAASDTVTNNEIEIPGPYAREKVGMLASAAWLFGARTVRWRIGKGGYIVRVFAYGADLERITMLWRSLSVQALRGLAAPAPSGENTATWRRSWLVGFHLQVMSRLYAIEHEAQRRAAARPEGVGARYALAVRDKGAVVDQQVTAVYPGLKAAVPSRARYSVAGLGRRL